jgi:hypothetical protein
VPAMLLSGDAMAGAADGMGLSRRKGIRSGDAGGLSGDGAVLSRRGMAWSGRGVFCHMPAT